MHQSGHRVTTSLFSIRSTASPSFCTREHRILFDQSVGTMRRDLLLDHRRSLQFGPRSNKKLAVQVLPGQKAPGPLGWLTGKLGVVEGDWKQGIAVDFKHPLPQEGRNFKFSDHGQQYTLSRARGQGLNKERSGHHIRHDHHHNKEAFATCLSSGVRDGNADIQTYMLLLVTQQGTRFMPHCGQATG